VRGDVEPPPVADFHFLQGFGPAGNDAVDGELGGVLVVGAVEDLAVEKHAGVVNADDVGGLRRFAGSGFGDEVLQAGFGGLDALLGFVRGEEFLAVL